LVADSGGQGGQRLAVFQFYDAAAVFSGAAIDNRDAVGVQDRGDAAQFGSEGCRLLSRAASSLCLRLALRNRPEFKV
jgi:hypothetical protein